MRFQNENTVFKFQQRTVKGGLRLSLNELLLRECVIFSVLNLQSHQPMQKCLSEALTRIIIGSKTFEVIFTMRLEHNHHLIST